MAPFYNGLRVDQVLDRGAVVAKALSAEAAARNLTVIVPQDMPADEIAEKLLRSEPALGYDLPVGT